MNKKPTEGQLLNAAVELRMIKGLFKVANQNHETINAIDNAIYAINELLECRAQQVTNVIKITFPENVKIETINNVMQMTAQEIEIDAPQTSYKWHPQQDDKTRKEHMKSAFLEPFNVSLPESVMVALKRVASLSIAIRNARNPDKLINSLDSAEAALVAEIDSHASTICGKPDEGGGNGANYY